MLKSATLASIVALSSSTAAADAFESVAYDAQHDALVVTMIYRGTKPNHDFSIHWEACKETGRTKEVAAEILDAQWQDKAEKDFRKTVSFPLEDMQCRPAQLTLRTPPNFIYTIVIPEKTPQHIQ